MTQSTKNEWEPVITMVQCPWCKTDWIDEAHEYVCANCLPEVDSVQKAMAVHAAIRELDRDLTSEQIKKQLPLLRRAKEHLDAIVEAISK